MFRFPRDAHPAASAGARFARLPRAERRRVRKVRRAVHDAARHFADNPAARATTALAVRANGRYVAIRITRKGAPQGRFRTLWTFGREG